MSSSNNNAKDVSENGDVATSEADLAQVCWSVLLHSRMFCSLSHSIAPKCLSTPSQPHTQYRRFLSVRRFPCDSSCTSRLSYHLPMGIHPNFNAKTRLGDRIPSWTSKPPTVQSGIWRPLSNHSQILGLQRTSTCVSHQWFLVPSLPFWLYLLPRHPEH